MDSLEIAIISAIRPTKEAEISVQILQFADVANAEIANALLHSAVGDYVASLLTESQTYAGMIVAEDVAKLAPNAYAITEASESRLELWFKRRPLNAGWIWNETTIAESVGYFTWVQVIGFMSVVRSQNAKLITELATSLVDLSESKNESKLLHKAIESTAEMSQIKRKLAQANKAILHSVTVELGEVKNLLVSSIEEIELLNIKCVGLEKQLKIRSSIVGVRDEEIAELKSRISTRKSQSGAEYTLFKPEAGPIASDNRVYLRDHLCNDLKAFDRGTLISRKQRDQRYKDQKKRDIDRY